MLVYTAVNLPVAVFCYTTFVRTIPPELDDAAACDGCGPVRTFVSVVLPLLRPVTGVLVLFVSLQVWNDLVAPLVLLGDPGKRTLMANTYALVDPYHLDPPGCCAAAAARLRAAARGVPAAQAPGRRPRRGCGGDGMTGRPPLPPALLETRLMAILRAPDAATLEPVAVALAAAGVRCLEVAMTGTGALDVVSRLRTELSPEVLVGAGSVITADQAHAGGRRRGASSWCRRRPTPT